ncbi:MAG: TIGR01906 family membrane protein [Bacilli bacterium]|nr:TIGR01906 family membrane protein [Bacilli bacterium]
MKKKLFQNIWTGVYAIALILLAISFSIALPIYFRPFYYMLINPMHIVQDLNSYTGLEYTFKDVVEAYNEVLNYCCFYTKFGTGKLAWSQDGMEHFRDCRGLFTLDTVVMIVSAAVVGTTHILKRKKIIEIKPLVHLISGITSVLIPTILGILVSLDFDKAFVIFHKIFFPGKDNWLFDYDTDQIILILPENFFMACAIFIGVALIGVSTYYIVRGIIRMKKEKSAA